MTDFQSELDHAQNALRARRLADAAGHFRLAVASMSSPAQSQAIEALTRVFHQAGDFATAVDGYRVLLKICGATAARWHNLGLAQYSLSNFAEAANCFQQAARLDTRDPETFANLGNALRESGQLNTALEAYQRAIAIQPACFDAHLNMGITYRQMQRIDEALQCYQRAMRLQPKHAYLHYCMARAYQAAGKTKASVKALNYCLSLDPNYKAARNALGNHLQAQGQWQAAIEQYQQILREHPADYRAWNNLGTALRHFDKNSEAIRCFQRSCELAPHVARTHANLGQALREEGQFAKALEAYSQACELEPENWELLGSLLYLKQRLCDWEDIMQQAKGLELACASGDLEQSVPHPLSVISLPVATTAAQQLKVAQAWGKQYPCTTSPSVPAKRGTGSMESSSKVRLGYLSADFYDHPVAGLMSEIFELHDRKQFEVFAYSIGRPDQSHIRKRIVQSVDCFRDEYANSFQATANRIMEDGVDVLVDLMGYTKGSRTQILAHRPAPIQVNYLGFPGTMGVDYMDYIIVDSRVVPPEQHACYREAIVRLPDCYLPCDSHRLQAMPEVNRQQFQIPDEALLLCSFVNSYKITPLMFDVWMRLLHEVPESVLWLFSHNEWVVHNLQREASTRGVDPKRLIFSKRLPLGEHLARHRLADVFLDSYPYNGHTTASDALRCGLPLVTLRGPGFASRVAASLLDSLGMPQLIADDFRQYYSICLRLATDASYRLDLRRRLKAAVSQTAVFKSRVITSRLEQAYRRMYQAYYEGTSPTGFEIVDQ